jgi:hypothetical protein
MIKSLYNPSFIFDQVRKAVAMRMARLYPVAGG